MRLLPETLITVQYPESEQSGFFETTWSEFAAANSDDSELLAEIVAQIAEHNYAEIGGGASPQVWIFA